jgi:sugar O-acyltransferase (sialic acid O-acetyltransferase NeuD family)
MLNIIIIGAGGFGREVYQWAKDSFDNSEYQIKGFISNKPDDLKGFNIEVGILGDDVNYKINENDRFLFGIGNIDVKKRIVRDLKKRGAQFITLIHKTAVVATNARIGEGVIICPFATVSDSVVLDDFVMLNFYSSCGHDSKIGKYSILSPYSTTNGFVTLEEEVFLGTHSTVTAHNKVGSRSKISANSVAMHDVPSYTFVYGVPGKHQTIFKSSS